MRLSLRSASRAAIALALAATASTAGAQFTRTGGATTPCAFGVAGCDARWSVQWYGISALTSGVSGTLAHAALVTAPPTPPWAPNVAGLQQWIGVSPSANVSTARTSGNENNYRYFYSTTFSELTAATMQFTLGWDNKLVGAVVGQLDVDASGSYTLGAGAYELLAGVSPASPYGGGRSGFCRDGDGIFPSAQHPSCLLQLSLPTQAGAGDRLTFILQGDGATDGLLVGAASTVPEPASVVLVASGALAIGGVALRRRRRRDDD